MSSDAPGGAGGQRPDPGSAADRDRLVTEHLGLAEHLARRYANRGEPHDDLVQVASLALVRAADRYDPSLGYEFSTFATRTIVGELKHHFRDRGWSVKAPRQLQELYLEVNTTIGIMTQQLGRSPTVSEVAAACGRRDDEVLAALEAGQGYRAASLDAPSPSGESVLDVHEDVDNEVASVDTRDELVSHLARLPRRERELVRLRFVDELSQTEIAERLGMSQMHVSRLLRRALEALRESYGRDA